MGGRRGLSAAAHRFPAPQLLAGDIYAANGFVFFLPEAAMLRPVSLRVNVHE